MIYLMTFKAWKHSRFTQVAYTVLEVREVHCSFLVFLLHVQFLASDFVSWKFLVLYPVAHVCSYAKILLCVCCCFAAHELCLSLMLADFFFK